MQQSISPSKKLFILASRCYREGNFAEAEALCGDALRIEPDNGPALHLLGTLHFQRDETDIALEFMARAAHLQPNDPAIHMNLGAAYRKKDLLEKAVGAYRKAIALDPLLSGAFFNLGHAFRDLGQLDDAITAYTAYLAHNAGDCEGYIVLGHACKAARRVDEAISAYESALALQPDHTVALLNIVEVLVDLGWLHAALVCLERGIAIAPENDDIRLIWGTALLRAGQLREGWIAYDSRFAASKERIFSRLTPPAYWGGEDLSGKTIVVWAEQGLGDEVLHASMLPEVIARAGRCVIECTPRMVSVFTRSFPTATVVGWTAPDGAVTPAADLDYQIPIGSLGHYLRPDFESFPKHSGYLKADPAKVATLRARYEDRAAGRRIVGLSWRSKAGGIGAHKSMDLLGLAPILAVPGILFVNLQYGDCAAELNAARDLLHVDIIQDPDVDPLTDMDTFFAQVAAMDMVLTTSNTTAHVAGAQNIPAWVLVPAARGALWYWFTTRADSPWYPSVRLIRQTRPDPDMPWWHDIAHTTATELSRWTERPVNAAAIPGLS